MTNEIYNESKKRAPSQRKKILDVLRKAGVNGVLNSELVEICIGYRSRIAELYKIGYKIRVDHVEKGVCIYTLEHEPQIEKNKQKPAIDILVSIINSENDGKVTSNELVKLLNDQGFNITRKHGWYKRSV